MTLANKKVININVVFARSMDRPLADARKHWSKVVETCSVSMMCYTTFYRLGAADALCEQRARYKVALYYKFALWLVTVLCAFVGR